MEKTTELLKKIALGYLFNYIRLGVSTRQTYTDTTSIEISYFANLGEYLGYRLIREKYRPDLIWENRLTNKTEMYLERETENRKAQNRTINKIIECNNNKYNLSEMFIRIGVFGWIKRNEYNSFYERLKKIDNSLFISWIGNKKENVDEVIFVVNSNKKSTFLRAEAKIIEDYWCICKKEEEWKEY